MPQSPNSASLLLTEDCNLACTYCFEKHNKKKMSNEVAEKAIDWLSDNALKDGIDYFSVLLFGGEPLLNIDTIERTLEYGVAVSKEKGLRFTASMVTNATVMNDRIYSVLERYRDEVNLNIQLSVDGIPEVQDRYRITKAGKGSFEMVKKNIPIFQKLYGNTPDDRRLSIHGCVNKDTLPDLYKSYSFFRKELNFKQIWFLPIAEENWDENDVKIYREENQKIYDDYIAELRASKDISDSFNYAPFSRYDCLENRSSAPCGAGRNFVTITAEGDIYPCHQIYFNDPYQDTKIGNIFNDEMDEDRRRVFTDYDESDIGCGNCPNTQCYRCLAANWVHNGSLFSQIRGIYCQMSAVDFYFQNLLKKAVEEMGFNNNCGSCSCDHEVECLCNSREGISANGCDVVLNQDNCQSGNNPDNPGCLCDAAPERSNDDFQETVSNVLELMMIQMKNIEDKLDLLLSKKD